MWRLPRDVTLDIFSRLPTTSVLQLKYVCRAWRELAQESILADMHFQRRAEDDPCLIFCDNSHLYCVESLDCSKGDLAVKKLDAPSTYKFQVAASSAGLLCLCDTTSKNKLAIYNPFTTAYLELPEFKPFSDRAVLFGFGTLSTMREYKVVKIIFSWHESPMGTRRFHGSMKQESNVEILTVGSSKWRSLGTVPYNFSRGQPQVLVNGKLHWLTRGRRTEPGCRLISFDLKEERFGEMNRPPPAGWSSYSLATLGGCLSAIGCDSQAYEIWVLKNYNEMESWVKQYSIMYRAYRPRELEPDERQGIRLPRFAASNGRLRALCVLRTGEIILQYQGRALVAYDEKSGTCKDLNLQSLPDYFDTTVHVGSLYSIDAP